MPNICARDRILLVAATVPLLVAAAGPAPAIAGVAEAPNACKFSYDGEYRTQAVELTASAPAGAAGGQPLTLSGEKIEVKLRPQLARDAAAVGLLPSSGAGVESTIVTKTWIAIKGTNTREGTQVIGPISVTATTTVFYDESAQAITATPFAYTPPKLPDTTWTGTGGEIAFSQAGAGAIAAAQGQLPVGGGGNGVAVAGSAVVQANLPGGVNFFMDCQPGETVVTRPEAGAGTSFNPLTASPFASVAVAGTPSNPDGTPVAGAATGATAAGRIASSALVATAGKLRLKISCAGAAGGCAGSARVTTRRPVRIGRAKPRIVNLVRIVRYTVAQGKSRTLTLGLSLDAKHLLRRGRTQAVTVTLKPGSGKATTRNVTLRRG